MKARFSKLLGLCAPLGLCVLAVAPRVYPQIQPGLDLQLYAGLSITGEVSAIYSIQCTTNLTPTNYWLTLTTLILPSSPYLWVDTTCAAGTGRSYRTVLQPLVFIPAGSFTMGDTFTEGWFAEVPTHSVYVSAFYMDKNEVAKALWDEVKTWNGGNGYSYTHPGSGKAANHPVQMINWYDAVKWCNARSQKEGLTPCYYTDAGLTIIYRTGESVPYVNWDANGYRLPTEAEWEKAARGGTAGRRFPWSDVDTISHGQANYNAKVFYSYDLSYPAGYHRTYAVGAQPYTSPVGSFAPNGYGLYDMAGNVTEMCWDWLHNRWYENPLSTQNDTRGPAGPGLNRICRGGAWYEEAYNARCAWRDGHPPASGAFNSLGFRCVRGL